ncbi:MAG TPA: hypothetical protein VGZ91_13685 [Candidatus Sulfotelmatobacter sp.]|jgi:hypothetical protein|nr:hypothetical protein [Candidatus Sulfotelmatobacter sp.]
MRRLISLLIPLLSVTLSLAAQTKRLWVLRAPGEAVEYDSATLAEKQTVKIPSEAVASPSRLSINHAGQMLFAPLAVLPLTEGDLAAERKVWLWDGHTATSFSRDVSRSTSTTGSNLAITESAPVPSLAEDGAHIYWFSNQARRLQRDSVDLSIKTTWTSWRTDLGGTGREDIASIVLPDCSCPTGACEDSCPSAEAWVPEQGLGNFFLLNLFVQGQTQTIYKSTSVYRENAGKWMATPLNPPLRQVLDAANVEAILEAIPDTGCCGWSNESDDQTLLHLHGKTLTMFDEIADYKNPDYDVSFSTENGKLSPGLGSVAFTIVSTAKPNSPIQLAEQGQANPEESQRIRKALLDLPAVEVKSVEEVPRRIAFLPHAALVGWISDKEILIVEDHMLVAYGVASGSRRKSNIRVEDFEHVFLR